MTDVFTVLRADHEQLKSMIARLEDGPKMIDGASMEQLWLRQQLAADLIFEEARHEAAEQQCFWPAVQELGPDGARVAELALEQEQEAEQVLSELSKLSADDPRFEEVLAMFIRGARAHISYEEAHAWPLLSVEITQPRAEEMGEEIARAKVTAPTRPHPTIPPQVGSQRAAGPMAAAVAAADKIRDALTGRGRP